MPIAVIACQGSQAARQPSFDPACGQVHYRYPWARQAPNRRIVTASPTRLASAGAFGICRVVAPICLRTQRPGGDLRMLVERRDQGDRSLDRPAWRISAGCLHERNHQSGLLRLISLLQSVWRPSKFRSLRKLKSQSIPVGARQSNAPQNCGIGFGPRTDLNRRALPVHAN